MIPILWLALLLLASAPKTGAWYRIDMEHEHEKSNVFENSTTASQWSKDNAWQLPLMKGVMKGQILHLRKLEDHPNKWHSCYEVHCENEWKNFCPPKDSPESTIQFCYPAIVITGVPKCGTTATYDLLSRYSGAITMFEKENCPYVRRRSHWEFFHTLPKASDVKPGQLLIDACLSTEKEHLNNMRIRRLLHEPETLYILMTRNYADMVWSSYNYWCKREYDGLSCDNTRWVHSDYNRSISLFHDMVIKDKEGTLDKFDSPFHGDMIRPCINAGGYFKEFAEIKMWSDRPGQYITRGTDPEHTLFMASEELESDPMSIWIKISKYFGMKVNRDTGANDSNDYRLELGNFRDFRKNTQDNKGTNTGIPIADYRPGVFAISNYEPLRDDTRKILDECWIEDCKYVSKATGYSYAACANQ
jgi:hypothetical protein